MQRTLVLLALLSLCCRAQAAVTSDFTLQWKQEIPAGNFTSEVATIGDTHITLAGVLPAKKNDAPRAAVLVGTDAATKTALYPGKTYHLALVRRGEKLSVFVNGFAEPSFSKPIPGTLSAFPNTMTVTEKALSPKEILAHVKSQLQSRDVVTVGHRGDNRFAPENTNIAYVQCIEKHTPIVELDLRLTKDNVLVLLHDATLDRTTDGTGPLLEMNYADAKQLDAGSWKDPKFKGEPIPLVADVAKTCQGKAIMMLDLKCTGLGESIAAMKMETNFPADQLILAPWEDEEGVALRKYIPDVPMIRLTSKIPETFDDAYFARMKQIGFSGFSVNFQYLTTAFIQAAHKNNFKIYTWTVNDEAEVAGAVINGVDGIITDDPAGTMKLITELNHR